MEPAGGAPPKEFAPKVAWDPEVEAYLRGALGDERFERAAAALCRPPRTTCLRVNTLRTTAEEVVAAVRRQLGPEAAEEGVVSIHPQVPSAAAAAVGDGAANATKPDALSTGMGVEPDVEMFRAREGLALELVQPVFRVPPAVSECRARGAGAGRFCHYRMVPGSVRNLVRVERAAPGLGHAAEPAQPGLAPGMRVLDMCAAPGGKTTLMAALMGDVGEVVAFDRTHAKVAEVVALAREMGATCIKAHKMDAGSSAYSGQRQELQPGQQQPGQQQPLSDKARLREERRRANMLRRGITPPEPAAAAASAQPGCFPPESFDALLLDAPCSALGLRPRLQQQAGALYLRQCAAAQRRLVDGAVRLLRVGGAMVYSTCTINPGENEAVVRYLLDSYGGSMRLVPAGPPFLGGPGLAHDRRVRPAVLLRRQGHVPEPEPRAALPPAPQLQHAQDALWLSMRQGGSRNSRSQAAAVHNIH
eukprot:XP_001699083.1 predicted protein [Chlamydomonas reinhardtii]